MAAPSWSTATTLASSACSTQAWTSMAGKTSNWASGFVCHPVTSRSCSPFFPRRFKWSNDHCSVAPLINEAPLGVPVDRSCVCTSQQGCGKRYSLHMAGIFSCIFLLNIGQYFIVLQCCCICFCQQANREYGIPSKYR